MQRRLNMEKVISSISSELMTINPETADNVINRILGELAIFTQADRCSLTLLDKGEISINTLYQWCIPGVDRRIVNFSGESHGYKWLAEKFKKKEIIGCKRVTDLPTNAITEIEHWLDQGIVSLLIIPIGSTSQQNDAVIGVETLDNERNWTEDDHQVLQIAGEMIVTSLAKLESDQKLRLAEARYRLVVEQISAVVYIDSADTLSSGVYMSPQIKPMTGYTPEELLSDPSLYWRIVHPDDRDWLLDLNSQTNLTGEPFTTEYRLVTRDGKVIWVQDNAILSKGENGISQWHGVIFDISARKQIEQALGVSQSRYSELFENSPVSLWEEDFSRVKKRIEQLKRQGTVDFHEYLLAHPKEVKNLISMVGIIDVNQTALKLTGFSDKESLLADFTDLRMVRPDGLFLDEFTNIANGYTQFEVEGPNDIVNGEVLYHNVRFIVLPGYENTLERVIVAVTDITERKATEEQLIYLSTHDSLTGLFSRSFFETELQRLQDSRQYPISILMADADRLKETNDKEGHAAGDKLIIRAAQLLRLMFRPEDVVARIGGDEFAVIIPKTDETSATKLLDRFHALIEQENQNHPELPALGLSIGIATAENGMPLTELLREADRKMYHDKEMKRKISPSSVRSEKPLKVRFRAKK